MSSSDRTLKGIYISSARKCMHFILNIEKKNQASKSAMEYIVQGLVVYMKASTAMFKKIYINKNPKGKFPFDTVILKEIMFWLFDAINMLEWYVINMIINIKL